MSKWKSIKEFGLPPKGTVLITNNITAKDAYGGMSHVWLTHLIFNSGESGFKNCEYAAYDATSGTRIHAVTHWCKIPNNKEIGK